MDTVVDFQDYYLSDFIDPLYRPYCNRQHKFNNLTMNRNELRFDKGLNFKLKHSEYPCPMGFEKTNDGWCQRKIEQIPLFYLFDRNKNFYQDKNFYSVDYFR